MKKLVGLFLLLVLFLVQSSDAALVKTDEDVDEWQEVAQNVMVEGTAVDISANYYTALHIDMAATSAVAHAGTKIRIQVSSSDAGDKNWTTYLIITGPTGIPNLQVLGGAEAAGQTLIEIGSTTGYEADEARWIFLEDDTVADSEMLMLVSYVSDTSITILDGLANPHTAADTLTNIAQNYVEHIPPVFQRVRVVFDNTYDSDGSAVHVRTRLSKVTEM